MLKYTNGIADGNTPEELEYNTLIALREASLWHSFLRIFKKEKMPDAYPSEIQFHGKRFHLESIDLSSGFGTMREKLTITFLSE